MHNLYVMWFYALQFVTYKVSVNAFSLLYSKLLIVKLSLFVFGVESHWRFVSRCSCFISDELVFFGC